MRRVAAVVGAVAFVVATTAVFAQKPNFAGKWTRDAEKTAAANPNMAGGGAGGGRAGGGAGGGGGARGGAMGGAFELKMDGNKLSRISEGPNGPMTTEYILDGAKHDGAQQGTSYVGKIEGATVVIDTTRTGQDGTPTTSKAVYSMDGEWLVIANTNPPRGGQGEAMTIKTYYKKA